MIKEKVISVECCDKCKEESDFIYTCKICKSTFCEFCSFPAKVKLTGIVFNFCRKCFDNCKDETMMEIWELIEEKNKMWSKEIYLYNILENTKDKNI